MATHNPYFDEPVAFDPAATGVLTEAIEKACRELQIPPANQRERKVIAARIADLARSGELDAEALSDRVVREAQAQI